MTRARGVVVAVALAAALALTACSEGLSSAPACTSARRLAIVAQAVPSAAYVPCVDEVPEGWTVEAFEARDGRSHFSLLSDRAQGREVRVELTPTCDPADAVPSPPRAEGVRTAIHLDSISPRYAGTLYDVFAGGCVTYRFDFPRGAHIALMEDLQAIVGLMARRDLRLAVQHELGIDLGP